MLRPCIEQRGGINEPPARADTAGATHLFYPAARAELASSLVRIKIVGGNVFLNGLTKVTTADVKACARHVPRSRGLGQLLNRRLTPRKPHIYSLHLRLTTDI